jgi:excisionase family DNA binding protein
MARLLGLANLTKEQVMRQDSIKQQEKNLTDSQEPVGSHQMQWESRGVEKLKRPTSVETTSEPKCRDLTQTYLSPSSGQRKGIKKLAYSKREAAEATSLSVRTLEYLIQRGQLKAVKAPGTTRVLIPARHLEALVNGGVLNGRN